MTIAFSGKGFWCDVLDLPAVSVATESVYQRDILLTRVGRIISAHVSYQPNNGQRFNQISPFSVVGMYLGDVIDSTSLNDYIDTIRVSTNNLEDASITITGVLTVFMSK